MTFFRDVAVHKNQYTGGNCPKREAWAVCRFNLRKWGLAKKRVGGIFEDGGVGGGGWGGGVVDTPMHDTLNDI